jgi:hypothetical protein
MAKILAQSAQTIPESYAGAKMATMKLDQGYMARKQFLSLSTVHLRFLLFLSVTRMYAQSAQTIPV